MIKSDTSRSIVTSRRITGRYEHGLLQICLINDRVQKPTSGQSARMTGERLSMAGFPGVSWSAPFAALPSQGLVEIPD
jgi:hypothetical protein